MCKARKKNNFVFYTNTFLFYYWILEGFQFVRCLKLVYRVMIFGMCSILLN